jgi:ABC-type phosphate transport system substrate-binding protein
LRALRAVPLALTMMLTLPGAAVVGADARPAPAGFQVIVNPANPAGSIDRKFLADAFLKKITRWPHEEAIRPVDLAPDSPVRRRFSDDVLKRSVAAIKSYWQQLVFSGRDVPPPELDTDEQVVKYVLRYPGAVGYVSGAANLENAKVLTVR